MNMDKTRLISGITVSKMCRIYILGFFALLAVSIFGCVQQGAVIESDDSTIKWGKNTGESFYLQPEDYAESDPLGRYARVKNNGKSPGNRSDEIVMNDVPGGSFIMGSNDGNINEKPAHTVYIQPFMIGQTEITQAQWRNVMGRNPSYFKDCDNCPVENISWVEVQLFIIKLNRKMGLKFRLPTEAEWEYACRYGSNGGEYCGGKWEGASCVTNHEKTQPVGSLIPNALGLYDMCGNVWEWVQDCYTESYSGAPTNGNAWIDGNCDRRIVRGKAWDSKVQINASTYRYWWGNNRYYQNTGFRLALD